MFDHTTNQTVEEVSRVYDLDITIVDCRRKLAHSLLEMKQYSHSQVNLLIYKIEKSTTMTTEPPEIALILSLIMWK